MLVKAEGRTPSWLKETLEGDGGECESWFSMTKSHFVDLSVQRSSALRFCGSSAMSRNVRLRSWWTKHVLHTATGGRGWMRVNRSSSWHLNKQLMLV